MKDIQNLLYVFLKERQEVKTDNIYVETVPEVFLFEYPLICIISERIQELQTFYDSNLTSNIATIQFQVYSNNRKETNKIARQIKKTLRNFSGKLTNELDDFCDISGVYLLEELEDLERLGKDKIEYRTILSYNIFWDQDQEELDDEEPDDGEDEEDGEGEE
jgi:hypothetical protein